MIVASTAIFTEFRIASWIPGTPNGSCQFLSVKPCQVKLKRLWVSLNENKMMIAIGSSR